MAAVETEMRKLTDIAVALARDDERILCGRRQRGKSFSPPGHPAKCSARFHVKGAGGISRRSRYYGTDSRSSCRTAGSSRSWYGFQSGFTGANR
ncbi:MAG TPA: hypothetical protein VIY51_25820 [Xanthobacteraceae bacterium]